MWWNPLCRPSGRQASGHRRDEAGYQLYQQGNRSEEAHLSGMVSHRQSRGLPKEFVQRELEFRWKLFPEKKEETK